MQQLQQSSQERSRFHQYQESNFLVQIVTKVARLGFPNRATFFRISKANQALRNEAIGAVIVSLG